MRNLKRALSLALASVMLVGLMVVGTGASYSDVSSKNNQEAIEVLKAVGIMTGDDKGNFNPDQNVTRNEMAVVMANMLDLSVSDFAGSKCPFTDVPAWAQAYVTACYADGIVAGTSATTYGGSNSVNAVQAGLMVMKALGYFQYQEDFGDDWQLAAVKQASKIDLYDDIDAGRTDAMSRNEVAQLVLNALKADVVEFTGTLGTDIKTTDGTNIKVGYLSKYDSIVRSSENSDNYAGSVATSDGYGYQQLCEKLYKTDLKMIATTDEFGRSASKWTYKLSTVGTYGDKADATYTNKVTKGALYDLVGKDVYDDLKDGTKASAKLTVVIDGQTVQDGVKTATEIGYYIASKNTASIGDTGSSGTAVTGNGTSTEVYINDSTNAVTVVIINTYLAQATDDYNKSKETLKIQVVGDKAPTLATGETTLSNDDFAVSNYAEDDYLLITVAGTAANNKVIKSVTPATLVTGNVSTFSSGNNVTIDGTKYSYGFMADASSSNGKAVSYQIDEDTTVVTDSNGYVLYVDEVTTAADKYVYVADVADKSDFSTSNTFIADAYFLDGTHATIDLKNKLADGTTAVTASTPAGWYSYTVNSSNQYTLGALTPGATENKTGSTTTADDALATLVENNKASVNGGAVKVNSATVFVVIDDDDDVTSYTGIANVPTIKNKLISGITYSEITAQYVVAKTAGFAKYVFIDASDNASIDNATSSSSDFIYLLKYDSTNKDADKNTYFIYKAIVNGEVGTVKLSDNFSADDTQAANLKYGLYTDVKYDENGYVDSMNVVDGNDDYTQINTTLTDATITYVDGILTVGGPDFVVDSKCKIYLVAADTNVKEDGGSTYEVSTDITANSLYTTLKSYNGKIDGAYYAQVDDDTDTLTALYVYVSATV